MLPRAMAATVLASSYIVRIPTMWRQAPITAAFVIAARLQHQSRITALWRADNEWPRCFSAP